MPLCALDKSQVCPPILDGCGDFGSHLTKISPSLIIFIIFARAVLHASVGLAVGLVLLAEQLICEVQTGGVSIVEDTAKEDFRFVHRGPHLVHLQIEQGNKRAWRNMASTSTLARSCRHGG